MLLKNKKTGEIVDADFNATISGRTNIIIIQKGPEQLEYGSLAELNADWEDVPEEPKEYWFMDYGGRVKAMNDANDEEDEARKQIGNYFETKEEAELAVRKLEAWKRLKDKGLEVTEWSHGFYLDKTIVGRFRYEFPIDKKEDIEKYLDLLFPGGEE